LIFGEILYLNVLLPSFPFLPIEGFLLQIFSKDIYFVQSEGSDEKTRILFSLDGFFHVQTQSPFPRSFKRVVKHLFAQGKAFLLTI